MIRVRHPKWNDNEYDNCDNTAVAVLEVNGMTIPLCEDCLNELTNSIESYKNTIFCYQCKNAARSNSRSRLSCLRLVNANNDRLTVNDIGYKYSVDNYDTCPYAELAKNQLGEKYNDV